MKSRRERQENTEQIKQILSIECGNRFKPEYEKQSL